MTRSSLHYGRWPHRPDEAYQQTDLIHGDLLDWREVGARPPDPTWPQRTNRADGLKFEYRFRC